MLPHSRTGISTERAYRDRTRHWLAPCTLSPPLSAAEGGWAPKMSAQYCCHCQMDLNFLHRLGRPLRDLSRRLRFWWPLPLANKHEAILVRLAACRPAPSFCIFSPG